MPWLFYRSLDMTNFDELLNSFQPQEASENPGFTFFDAQPKQQEPTPEEKDLQRLEGDIHSIFESRRLLNKAIATFSAVVGSSAGIHLFARLGIPALASGTLGGTSSPCVWEMLSPRFALTRADQLLIVSFPWLWLKRWQ
jgi:hypothetical protein